MSADVATSAITVVKIPCPSDANPIERVVSTVARVDMALADRLHDGDGVRSYSVARRAGALDVFAFDDDLASAVLRGEPDAKLVTRCRPTELLNPPDNRDMIEVTFETPCHFRVAGVDYQIPDPFHVFGSLLDRWQRLGWPDVVHPDLKRVGVRIDRLDSRTMRCGAQVHRGFVGAVRYDLRGLSGGVNAEEQRLTLWTLARFGEYRGVGKHTTSGMGRIRMRETR